MSLLYINENNAYIGIEANRFFIKYADGMKKMVPAETLESITIMGHAQMTTQCVQECLKRGIPVSYYSKGGTYHGRLQSTGHVNAKRQRQQCDLYKSEFALELSKKIIRAKLKNQMVVLRRYEKNKNISIEKQMKMMRICREKIPGCLYIPEIMGYEGQGAKAYFEGLSKVIDPEFSFHGRNKRPPRDEFNSMISLGYSVIMNELYGKIEAKGLNPYFGFLHRDNEKHPTLASDMMEEWRAVIVDAVVMSMINGHEIHKEDFEMNTDKPGCYIDYPVSFRRGIALQMGL